MVLAVVLIAWFTLLMLGSLYVERLWVRALGRGFRMFVAPGVIVHEYSHAVACLLTGARIEKIALFEATGGYVRHQRPRWPSWPPKIGQSMGMVVISFAPIVGCLGVIFATFALVSALSPEFKKVTNEATTTTSSAAPETPADSSYALASVQPLVLASAAEPTAADDNAGAEAGSATHGADDQPVAGVKRDPDSLPAAFQLLGESTWKAIEHMFKLLAEAGPIGWIGLYIMLSMVICMNPSKRDFQNSKAGWSMLLVLLIGACLLLGTVDAGGNSSMTADGQVLVYLVTPIAYTMALLLLAAAATTVIAAPLQTLRHAAR